MSTLRDKILKNSTISLTSTLDKSEIHDNKTVIPTKVPLINVALSGDPDGGLTSGLTMIAGPSKHFKSTFMLLMTSAFLKQAENEDAMILFYDSEFGTPASYVKHFNIDPSKMIHSPIMNVEELKFDIIKQLEGFERKDKVMIIIDSIGNLASKKEIDDAISGNSAADMTRAKQFKSLFRMVTPYLTIKDIPMVVVNHSYQTIEMFSKAVVSGGTGGIYSSDTIWIVGRQQDKEQGKELQGYHFVINIEKSRYLKEKSKIPITVSFDKGINRWSGMLDLALEGQFVAKPKKGYYSLVDQETGEMHEKMYKEKDIIDNAEIWKPLLESQKFKDYIKETYALSHGVMLSEEE